MLIQILEKVGTLATKAEQVSMEQFQQGNLMDFLIKALSFLLHLKQFCSRSYVGNNLRVKIDGSYLKQDNITFTHRRIMNIYIVYEITLWDRGHDDYLMLENSFFGTVKLLINVDISR